MRIPASLPLDERSDERIARGPWTETHGTTICHHHVLRRAPQQTAWGIPDFLVCVPDRTGRGGLASIQSR